MRQKSNIMRDFPILNLVFELGGCGVRQASAVVQYRSDARRPWQQATIVDLPPQEINLISCDSLSHVSDIKLIRTDTTLDLSQKAEKGTIFILPYYPSSTALFLLQPLL